MEDENSRDLPSAVELFRMLRRHVYAVLFDLNKKQLIAKNNPSQLPGWYMFIAIKLANIYTFNLIFQETNNYRNMLYKLAHLRYSSGVSCYHK